MIMIVRTDERAAPSTPRLPLCSTPGAAAFFEELS
jgi:hypothetical protein